MFNWTTCDDVATAAVTFLRFGREGFLSSQNPNRFTRNTSDGLRDHPCCHARPTGGEEL
jgi:hypothetical protein